MTKKITSILFALPLLTAGTVFARGSLRAALVSPYNPAWASLARAVPLAAVRGTLVRYIGIFVGSCVLAQTVLTAQAPAPTPARLITGTLNAELTVTSNDVSVAFYRDVLGLEVAAGRGGRGPGNPAGPAANQPGGPGAPGVAVPGNPPAGPGGPPAGAPNPGAGRGGGSGNLTGAIGGMPRIVRMNVPGATWQLELIEMTNIQRTPVNPRRQDVGATGLILFVRDLDVTLAALRKAGAPIVTVGGQPVHIGDKDGKGRAIMAKDPDGFSLEIRQLDPLPVTTAPTASNVIGVGMSVSVADTDTTVRYWRDMLDFELQPAKAFSSDKTALALLGTPSAQVRKTVARHPSSPVVWEFLEFKNIDRRVLAPRIQDPGNGAFIVLTQDMEALVKRLKASPETKILSVGGEYVPRGTDGGAIFFQEMNGFILEGCKGC